MRIIGFAFIWIIIAATSNAQSLVVYVSPGASLGYCFSTHGMSFGIDVDLCFGSKSFGSHPMNYGISVSKNWHKFKLRSIRNVHKQTMVNFMLENELVDFKVGFGKMKMPHGYQNGIQCRVYGLNYDISFTQSNYRSPWVGLKAFHYNRSNWRWLNVPYYTAYVKYKYDFQKSGLKNW